MPTLSSNVFFAVSTTRHGTMSHADDATVRHHRQDFLKAHNISLAQTVLVRLVYEGDDYRRFHLVDKSLAGDGMVRPSTLVADGVFTTTPDLALFLPVADCIAAVIYDPVQHVLGLVHLGRHNLEQEAGTHLVSYMEQMFHSASQSLMVHLGPAASADNYPLFHFSNHSLHSVARHQLQSAGVPSLNITEDSRDTTLDPTLFSHSQFLQGGQHIDGRQAMVAIMRP